MLETTTIIDVAEQDIDNLGHVNNSIYVTYLELARKDWYLEAGFLNEGKQNESVNTVIRKLEVDFNAESRLGDTLKVTTRPLRLGNTSFSFKQDIYNQKSEHLIDAIVTSVMFDTINRKSMKVVKEIARHFK